MRKIINPVLSGFHPDPSIIRVGDTYYIANSTFEWYPGVRLHSSKNLVDWKMIKPILTEERLLSMKGNPSGTGVWAPDLSYADDKFWLVYSDVKVTEGPYKDIRNYLTYADNIEGPWSDPVYFAGVGFDASLFHDDDGRKYLVQMQWDHREYHHAFDGIIVTEIDTKNLKLIPETRRKIYEGTDVKLVEGPHLYKINGYYYLFAAQGGTVYTHQEVVARSRTLDELSFETEPDGPFITNVDTPDSVLQKQGHGSLIETPSGEWYYASLCGRPWNHSYESKYDPRGWCTLGRETSIQKVYWDAEGWPRIVGGHGGSLMVEPPKDAIFDEEPVLNRSMHDEFTENRLDICWDTLRGPFNEYLGKVGDGKLTLIGRGPLNSTFDVSLVARRWQAFSFDATTAVSFDAGHYQEIAGLTCFYNDEHFSFVGISWDEKKGRVIEVAEFDGGKFTSYLKDNAITVPLDAQRIWLKAKVRTQSYTYEYSFDGRTFFEIPVTLDAAHLSDDYVRFTSAGFFTGAYVGLFAMDLTGFGKSADFHFFDYDEK